MCVCLCVVFVCVCVCDSSFVNSEPCHFARLVYLFPCKISRKWFTALLPITALLPDDIRSRCWSCGDTGFAREGHFVLPPPHECMCACVCMCVQTTLQLNYFFIFMFILIFNRFFGGGAGRSSPREHMRALVTLLFLLSKIKMNNFKNKCGARGEREL